MRDGVGITCHQLVILCRHLMFWGAAILIETVLGAGANSSPAIPHFRHQFMSTRLVKSGPALEPQPPSRVRLFTLIANQNQKTLFRTLIESDKHPRVKASLKSSTLYHHTEPLPPLSSLPKVTLNVIS